MLMRSSRKLLPMTMVSRYGGTHHQQDKRRTNIAVQLHGKDNHTRE